MSLNLVFFGVDAGDEFVQSCVQHRCFLAEGIVFQIHKPRNTLAAVVGIDIWRNHFIDSFKLAFITPAFFRDNSFGVFQEKNEKCLHKRSGVCYSYGR